MKRDLYKAEKPDSNSDSDFSTSQPDYLCDKAGEADAEIARLENLLGSLSFKARAASFELPDSLSVWQMNDASQSRKVERASLASTTVHHTNRTQARTLTFAVAAMLLLSGMLFYFAWHEQSLKPEDLQAHRQAEQKPEQVTRTPEIESAGANKSNIASDVREAKSDDMREARGNNAPRQSANLVASKRREITVVNIESSRSKRVQSKNVQLKNQSLTAGEDVGNHEQAVQDLAVALLLTQRALQSANEQLQARATQSVEPFVQRLNEKIFDGRSERNAP